MKFSARLPRDMRPNALSELLAAKRRQGAQILDLTESNPTHAGIVYPRSFLTSLASDAALNYEPEPFGMPAAREIIAHAHGADRNRVVLTASTSEAYSWLFKLLCDPGDEILIPRPSYPLFDYLAALESVAVKHYGLFYDHGWYIDFHTLERSITDRTRAVVLVNPNNPTGHFVKRHELEQLARFGLPIISDEVFRDYRLNVSPDSILSLQDSADVLTFSLHGLSKAVGLPQMKLAWMIASGPERVVSHALERLEMIADTYLSVGTPVQCALESLLELRTPVQSQIIDRLRSNLDCLRASGLRFIEPEAGWYAIIRLAEGAELRLLEENSVLLQPGYFYDFENPNYFVISLLTQPGVFTKALERVRG